MTRLGCWFRFDIRAWILLSLCLSAAALQVEAQTGQGSGLPLASRTSFATTDAGGSSYLVLIATTSTGTFIQTEKISPQGAISWTRTFGSATGISVPAGVAVDNGGNVYVSGNDFANSNGFLLKYDPTGVFVSSQTTPYPGASFSPLVSGLSIGQNNARLYAAETFLDPRHGGLTSVLVMSSDLNLSPNPAYIFSDGAGINDEVLGVVTDGVGNVDVGVAQWNVGSSIPSHEIVKLDPALSRVLSVSAPSTPASDPAIGNLIGSMSGDPTVTAPQGPMQVISQVSTGWLSPVFALSPFYAASNSGTLTGEDQVGRSCIVSATTEWDNNNPAPDAYAFTDGMLGCLLNFGLFPPISENFSVTLTVSVGGALLFTYSGSGRWVDLFYGPNHIPWVQVNITPAAPKLQLAIFSGDGQAGTVSGPLLPLTVKVTDGSGNPRSGIPIIFSPPVAPPNASGSGLSVTEATTDSNGFASTALTLGNLTGSYQVTAACSQCAPDSVTFNEKAQLFLQIQVDQTNLLPSNISKTYFPLQRLFDHATLSAKAVGVLGEPVPNYKLSLLAAPVSTSGGHDHDDTIAPRPSGSFLTYSPSQCGSALGSTASGTTDANGQVAFCYRPSIFGGQEILHLQSANDPNVTESVSTITAAIPDLHPLPIGGAYSQTGSTPNHRNNHSISSFALPDIQAAAQEFLRRSGEVMRINDISLPNGGGFDIAGRWKRNVVSPGCRASGHCWHRLGRSADVENLDAFYKLLAAMAHHNWTYIDEGQLGGTSTRFPHFEWGLQ